MNARRAILFIAVVVGLSAVAAASAALLMRGGHKLPPAKQAILDARAQQKAAASSRPHGPKGKMTKAPGSCPRRLKPGVLPVPAALPGATDLRSEAVVVTPGVDNYYVWGGATNDDPKRGVIIVLNRIGDTCANVAQNHFPVETPYPTPTHTGFVTLTRVEGATVLFKTSGGSTGRFNVVTGKYR
jgi:hypothetical protein